MTDSTTAESSAPQTQSLDDVIRAIGTNATAVNDALGQVFAFYKEKGVPPILEAVHEQFQEGYERLNDLCLYLKDQGGRIKESQWGFFRGKYRSLKHLVQENERRAQLELEQLRIYAEKKSQPVLSEVYQELKAYYDGLSGYLNQLGATKQEISAKLTTTDEHQPSKKVAGSEGMSALKYVGGIVAGLFAHYVLHRYLSRRKEKKESTLGEVPARQGEVTHGYKALPTRSTGSIQKSRWRHVTHFGILTATYLGLTSIGNLAEQRKNEQRYEIVTLQRQVRDHYPLLKGYVISYLSL